MRISEIRNPQDFQELCQSLLCAEFNDTQLVRDSSGDGGLDAYVPSTKTLYAMYCPEAAPAPKTYYERKIRKDLAKAVKLRDEKGYVINCWIFLTPEPMEEELHRYLTKKVMEAGFAEGSNQSELHLQDLLLKHRHLRSQFPKLILPDIESKLHEIQIGTRETRDQRTPEDEFSYYTSQALRMIHNKLSGFEDGLPRLEIPLIEEQWQLEKPVLLSGESGTGKSGIAATLARQAAKPVLLLDARNVASLRDEPSLRRYFNSPDPLSQTIDRMAQGNGFRLIIDQLDNLIGKESANLIINFALECAEAKTIEVIVISRNKEAHETRLLRRLTSGGFVEIESRKLREGAVTAVLAVLKINSPTQELVRLGQNLLNLEIICSIRRERPDFDFLLIGSEAALWEQYLEILHERESLAEGIDNADLLIATATEMARTSLREGKPAFVLEPPIKPVERRLDSWGIIVCQEGRIYCFGHEKFQDYLYARYMCEQGSRPSVVKAEVGHHRMRNILPLMEAIYAARNSVFLAPFLREVFDV
jgi:hypothetical protein